MFLVVGALVGALVTLILTSLFPADPAVGFAATAGYFLLFGIPAGIVLGAVVGLIIDRVSIARARTVTVEREVVGDDGRIGAPSRSAHVDQQGHDRVHRGSARRAADPHAPDVRRVRHLLRRQGRRVHLRRHPLHQAERASTLPTARMLAPAYPGSKLYHAVPGDLLEDADWLQQAIRDDRRRAARAEAEEAAATSKRDASSSWFASTQARYSSSTVPVT